MSTSTIEELSTSRCWTFLRQANVGRIALHGSGDDIEVFPVNYVVDRGSIVFTTAAGTKAELVRSSRRAAFEVDDFGSHVRVAWSIVVKGTPAVVRRLDDVVDAFDLEVPSYQSAPKPLVVRFVPDSITGRRFTVDTPG